MKVYNIYRYLTFCCVHLPFRKSTSCSGGHQRTSVRAAAAGAAGHPGPDPGLQVHYLR